MTILSALGLSRHVEPPQLTISIQYVIANVIFTVPDIFFFYKFLEMGLLGQGILQELLNGAYRKCVVSFSFKVAYFDHEQDTSGHVTQGACGNVSEHHCVGGHG